MPSSIEAFEIDQASASTAYKKVFNKLLSLNVDVTVAQELLKQKEKARHKSQTDNGGRSAVTGGGHMNALENVIANTVRKLNLPDFEIILGKPNEEESTVIRPSGRTTQNAIKLELPGYYRPEKKWDLLILSNKRLVAALEIKGQVRPSIGNNSLLNSTQSHHL
jgi:hypothetical protein